MAEKIEFVIEGVELERARQWLADHRCPQRYPPKGRPHAATGGAISYVFTPTGIGQAVSIHCACGAEHDITDYDSW